MTIRELWWGVADAIDDGLITEETGVKVVNTEVVPKLLVEKILEEMAEASKEIEDDDYVAITDFDDGYLSALKDFRIVILKLLNDLEGEE